MEDEPVPGEEPRAKRQKKDKGGRFAALQKLKDLQGRRSKNKYEVDNVDNVYDVVDEKEYSKRVLDRQDEDWIVDDDCGYVEDGREIFDDDLDAESIAHDSQKKGRGAKRKKKHISENAGRGNLQNLISNMPAKKKEEKLDDDDILSDIINEIDHPTTSKVTASGGLKVKPKQRFSLIAEKRAANLYAKSFTKPKIVQPLYMDDASESTNSKLAENDTQTDIEDHTVSNVIVYAGAEDTETEVATPEPEVKKKLLFTISDKKKVESKVEEQPVVEEGFADVDFDDDFDFETIDALEASASTKNLPDITEEQLSEGFTFTGTPVVDSDVVDMSDVPQSLSEDGADVFRFFWWDAYEDERNQPGVVLLFGKTFSEEQKKFVSCCVVVKNVQRKVYLLPRPFFLDTNGRETDKPVSIMDVYQEFNEDVAKPYNMSSYKSKKVMKKYAFDSSVPEESEYLEVRFEGKYDFHEHKFKTFSHVFGMNSTFLEIFLLDRRIKGPCWLNVSNYEEASNPYTHTFKEIRCGKPMDVSVMESARPVPPPPLVVMALNIKAGVNPKNNANEIALISCLVNTRYHLDRQAPSQQFHDHFCVLTKLSHNVFPNNMHVALTKYKATRVQKMDSEKALLNYFMAQFAKVDPDLIVGHDLNGYQFTILADRLQTLNATNYSRLSRIKRPNAPKLFERFLFSGRLVCDVKLSAKELLRCRSYDLETLCQAVLKLPEGQRVEIEPENIPLMYESCMELFRFISITMQDTAHILKMMFELNVIPLTLQITNIAGNIMSRTLMGGRSERNEFLLLHAFSEKGYIVPEKIVKKKQPEETTSKRKKPTYSGGLVLDPKVGFYDKLILLMDFNSLYPSIIQEYNICFTTMHTNDINEMDSETLALPDKSLPPGILPTEIRKLVESRREVKKLMKNPDLSPDLQLQYNIRQMALKLTANSMYGCLGFGNSRFFAKKLAALVTQKGREILTITRDIVQKLSYDVIYGDTDSIMINTNITDYDQVFKIGKSIKQEINQMYKQVELDIDGVFKYLLLLKKKKYAAVLLSKGKNGKLNEVQEHKGLDIVRRDWSQLAAGAGKFILNEILCDQSTEDKIENIMKHLGTLKDDLQGNNVPMQLLVITKQLTKDPKQYPDKNSLPHVLAALRHNKSKGKKFKAGDTVPYVICKDGTMNVATQRAYLLDELKTNPALKIDTDYYLAQQIYPVVSRILEPIESVDPYQIGTCLGVDVKIVRKPAESTGSQFVFTEIKRVEVLTRNSKPFVFNCLSCNYFNSVGDDTEHVLEACGNPECNVPPAEYISYVRNKLVLAIRDYERQYYKNEFTCEDPSCTVNTFKLPQRFSGKYPVCTKCNQAVMYKVYSEEDLYAQLVYFQRIFDLSKKTKRDDPSIEACYNMLKEVVDKFLGVCGYATVNLADLFGAFSVNKTVKEEMQIDATQVFDDVEDI